MLVKRHFNCKYLSFLNLRKPSNKLITLVIKATLIFFNSSCRIKPAIALACRCFLVLPCEDFLWASGPYVFWLVQWSIRELIHTLVTFDEYTAFTHVWKSIVSEGPSLAPHYISHFLIILVKIQLMVCPIKERLRIWMPPTPQPSMAGSQGKQNWLGCLGGWDGILAPLSITATLANCVDSWAHICGRE